MNWDIIAAVLLFTFAAFVVAVLIGMYIKHRREEKEFSRRQLEHTIAMTPVTTQPTRLSQLSRRSSRNLFEHRRPSYGSIDTPNNINSRIDSMSTN